MASIALGTALLAGSAISAGTSLAGAGIQANAATTAANEQATEAQNALDFQKQVFGTEQQNFAPFLQAGQTSIGDLMKGLQNGTFGPGSLPAAPSFTAPTLEQAQQNPGYQFAQQQGSKGILEGSAAAGGAISGGTLKALDQFNQELGTTNYQQVFNNALTGYQAQLAQYGTNLQAQNQEFNQVVAPAQIGSGTAASLATAGNNAATNIGSLMTGIGNAQAAGTIGTGNAISGGLSGVSNSVSQGLLLSQLLPLLKQPAGTGPG